MKFRPLFVSSRNRSLVAVLALGTGVSLVSVLPSRGAGTATEAPPAAAASKTQGKPAVAPLEKKETPEPSPIPAGPAKETPGGTAKKDVVPAKENKPADEASKDGKEKKESEKSSSSSKETKSKTEKAKNESSKSEEHVKKGEKVRLAMLTLKNSMPESSNQAGPFGEAQLDLRELMKRLDKAAKDKSVAGLVLDFQSPELGRGKVEELREAIQRFRLSGKKVYATLDSAMPADYLVACACDEIIMPETGELMLPGVHAEAMFYHGLLAKLGVEADYIHIGAYKSYAEAMTRDNFSEPVRENMNTLIDSIYDDMITTIVKDRPVSIAQAKEIVDTGLISAQKAKELGLIDRVAYVDTLRKELADKYKADPLVFVKNYGKKEVDTDFSGPMGFFKLMQAMMGGGSSSSEGHGKKIAIVYAVGPISTGKSETNVFGDESLGSTTIIDALREADEDKQVVAIVLRVDSPGGSALASDLIWHQTQILKKPLVASMGDVAASGGYYISMGAKKIIAAPCTITGSIGVVGGKMALTGLYEKIGVTTETIERGKNAGLFASSGKFTDSQREVVKKMMEETYDQFTSKASQGRKMPLDKLKSLAGGRIYTGRQAKENGLVDELGSLHDAVNEAKKLAGLAADAEVRTEVLPSPTNFLESLFGNLEAEKETRVGNDIKSMSPELVEVARKVARLRSAFDRPAALILPFDLNIR
ncbi:MAG TPA: signal peptide peptidase SppA [Lacipirellulaceae bacterium]|nr:signal peptide peptidase SppA [Lacipirellulaceae bacterium]